MRFESKDLSVKLYAGALQDELMLNLDCTTTPGSPCQSPSFEASAGSDSGNLVQLRRQLRAAL